MPPRSLIILLLVSMCCRHDDHDGEAPNFCLPDVYGNNVQLYSLLWRGPVVMITWALWCKMTIKELDALKPQACTLLAAHRLQILAISQDKQQSVSKVLPFADSHEWTGHYRILLDPANTFREIYNIKAMPTTIAVAQTGEIVYRHDGYKPGDEIAIIDTLKKLF